MNSIIATSVPSFNITLTHKGEEMSLTLPARDGLWRMSETRAFGRESGLTGAALDFLVDSVAKKQAASAVAALSAASASGAVRLNYAKCLKKGGVTLAFVPNRETKAAKKKSAPTKADLAEALAARDAEIAALMARIAEREAVEVSAVEV